MNKAYWDSVATTKVFTHPLPNEWLTKYIKLDAAILDVGCGYGRSCREVLTLGYPKVTGVDISSEMIRRAQEEVPGATFLTMDEGRLPIESETIDAVLLFAVLTCIPRDEDQRQLVSEIARVLRPGGVLILSTYPLQENARNKRRYQKFAEKYGCYGLFEIDQGRMLVRHHDRRWLDELFEQVGFCVREEKEIVVSTMNGNDATILQRCLEKVIGDRETFSRRTTFGAF